MKISSAVLCDFAEARQGLLTIVAGGITRRWPTDLPGRLGLFVALQVELAPAEQPFPHELRIDVTAPSGKRVADVRGGFQVGADNTADQDENVLVPMPIDLRDMPINERGFYEFRVTVDESDPVVLRVKVGARPAPPVPVGPVRRVRRTH